MARAITMATWALTAVETSRESSSGRHAIAPIDRTPSINGRAIRSPGIASVGFCPCVIARRLAWMLIGKSEVEE